MQFEGLHTERLRLRKFTPEVYDHIHKTMDDTQLMAVLGLAETEALEKEREKYQKGLATHNRTFVNFQVIDRQTGNIIGGCGFHTWFPHHNRAEIGYGLFNDEHKRKGLMTEALAAVLDYGFGPMGLHRVEALVAEWNTPSLKLLAKFNFTFEGTLREHYNVDGVMEDSVMYSLLKQEHKLPKKSII